MNVAGLRRNIKNLAHNYSDAQVNKLITNVVLSRLITACFGFSFTGEGARGDK
jgi:hypothetical protein